MRNLFLIFSLLICSLRVSAQVAPIMGDSIVCIGTSAFLYNSTPGGAWTSSNPAVASIVSTTGVYSGISAGSAVITYTAGSSFTTIMVTVLVHPTAIIGPDSICTGSSYVLSDAVPYGTWKSSDTTIITVNSTTGVITGISSGTQQITYSYDGRCFVFKTIHTHPTPDTITGATSVCQGSTTVLTNYDPGGTWSSSNPLVSVIDVFGNATGVSAGTAIISYTFGSGCYSTITLTVNPIAPITGPSSQCIGDSIMLTDAVPGGIWTSSNTATATIGSLSGIVHGIDTGIVYITYTLSTGCHMIYGVTNYPLPAAITGPTTMCVGATITVSDATYGGSWSTSSSITFIPVPFLSDITGLSAGTDIITYMLSTGCYTTATITVDPLPIITGITTITTGSTSTLTSMPGGIWTASSSVVSVDSFTGVVTGLTPGSAVVTYTLPTGCMSTTTVSVIAPLQGNIVISLAAEFELFPNPNKGTFTIKGTTGVGTNESMAVTITNVLGQVIYKGSVNAEHGKIDEQIILGADIANGVYMLKMHNGLQNSTACFVIEK